MNTQLRRVPLWPALCAMLAAGAPLSAHANRVEPVFVRAYDPALRTERTYFVGEAASDADAVDFRIQLIEAGARNVNLFLPDRIIVCDMPANTSPALSIPAGFTRAPALAVEAQAAFAYQSWSWIIGAYRSIDDAKEAYRHNAAPAAPFHDVVIPISPARIDEIERNGEKSRVMRGLAPKDANALPPAQSSAFLGGSVLVNVIFPESNGQFQGQTEDWSDADLGLAKQGVAEAMISWQGLFPKMDLSFAMRFHERIATGYEPIQHLMRTDPQWMLDVLRTMGWGQTNDMLAEVHQFNQDQRAIHRTQWVTTAFIASSRNTEGHKFGGGTANYTAYAFLGGPCMVEPFPAGEDPNGVGERLVYSQIVNHEVGHCFWTLDEYSGARGECDTASGYLNYLNGNLTIAGPGGLELRCNPEAHCIMHSAARNSINPRPWCRWSRGHLGVIDADDNGKPDIFESRPRVEFTPAGNTDTITTNNYTLRFRVIATAVPNRNSNLAPSARVDYALPLKRGWISLSTVSRVPINPIDGHWDEIVEDCEFHVQLAQAGVNAFAVNAENGIGMESEPAAMIVHFIGVNYSRTALTVKPNRIDVSWEIVGNPFGAQFNVFRLDPGEDMPGTKITSEAVSPEGPPVGGFISYRYIDRGVVPGQEYRYYVEGGFTLAFEDTIRDYCAPSRVVSQTAMIPLTGDVISNVANNPSRGPFLVSVQVPRTYGGPERAPVRLGTPVEVSIFSVNGQLVRTLTNQASLDDVMTLRWDGTDQRNRLAPSGVYFVRAVAGSTKGSQKIVLLR